MPETEQCVWMGAGRICQQIQSPLGPFPCHRAKNTGEMLANITGCKDLTLWGGGKGTRPHFGVRK